MRWSKTLDAGSIDADKLQHTILFQTMDMDSDVNSKMSSHDMDDKEDEEALLKAQTTELVEEPDPQHTMVMTPQYLELERSEVDGHPPGTQVVKVNANGQVVSCEMIPHVGSIDGDQHGLVVHVLPTSHGDLKDGTTYYTPATTQQLQRAGALITDERFLTEQLTTQHYEDDLLSHDLTDDDRRLAAALMAVQYSQQQKQQQNIAKLLEPGSIVTEGNVIMSVSDTMQSLISTNQLGKVVTDPTQGSMSDMVVEYIQQVEGTSSSSDRKQMRLVTYHTDGQTIHTTDAAQLQAIDESQLQTQVSPITHTPAKKIATTQMSPRARYKRLLEESQGHIVTGVRESAESAREAIVQKNEDEEEFDTDDDLNDSDYDVESGNRSSRRSLPHKKRIPRKLKNVNKKTTGQDKVFKCIKCDETFQTQNALTVHKQLHKNNKLLFNCEICGKPSPNQLQFFEHLKSHYEPPKDLQNDTGMQSMEQVLIDDTSIKEEEHIQSVSQILPPALPPPLACTQCGKIFRRQKALEKHVSTAHCQVEDVLEEIEEEEDEDMIDHSELLPEEMEDESLKKGGEWYTHHELTAVPVQHVMEQVEHKLETTEDGHHVLTEIAVSELQPVMEEISTDHLCDHCGENFELKSQLTLHMKEEHPEIKRKTRNAKKEIAVTDSATATTAAAAGEKVSKKWEQLTCPTCGRMFNHRNSLVYHLRSHTGERPHQCEVCGKSFFAASALKVHMRLHSGDKPYKCELCGRHFRQWGDLKYHCISIHTDEKQYQCEYCGKDFARKYSLIVHRRIHTGEKNYKCEFCNKTFRASSYLQNHRRIHTGEKPHPCDVCGKPFRVRSDMKRHMQTHTRDTGGSSHHHHQSVSAVTHAVVLSQSSQSSSQGGMDLSELDPVAAEITIQDGDRDEAAAASAALAQEQDASQQITEVAGEDVQEEVMQQYSRDPLETLKTYIVIPYM